MIAVCANCTCVRVCSGKVKPETRVVRQYAEDAVFKNTLATRQVLPFPANPWAALKAEERQKCLVLSPFAVSPSVLHCPFLARMECWQAFFRRHNFGNTTRRHVQHRPCCSWSSKHPHFPSIASPEIVGSASFVKGQKCLWREQGRGQFCIDLGAGKETLVLSTSTHL